MPLGATGLPRCDAPRDTTAIPGFGLQNNAQKLEGYGDGVAVEPPHPIHFHRILAVAEIIDLHGHNTVKEDALTHGVGPLNLGNRVTGYPVVDQSCRGFAGHAVAVADLTRHHGVGEPGHIEDQRAMGKAGAGEDGHGYRGLRYSSTVE